MINRNDFQLLNISNVPNNKDKLEMILNTFSEKSYSLKNIRDLNAYEDYGYSYETFRKILNHSCMIGILNCDNGIYSLSTDSVKFLSGENTFEEYMNYIIYGNKMLLNYNNIIYIIINIFPPSIDIKTFYNIFSYVGKDRIDSSSLASTGRNLRSVFALLNMAGKIAKYKNRIEVSVNLKNSEYSNINSLYNVFQNEIINIRDIRKYLNNYFTKDVSEKVLQCMATYEYENYIWVKGSLYKNNGEVKNLNNEFITTLMVKGR